MPLRLVKKRRKIKIRKNGKKRRKMFLKGGKKIKVKKKGKGGKRNGFEQGKKSTYKCRCGGKINDRLKEYIFKGIKKRTDPLKLK